MSKDYDFLMGMFAYDPMTKSNNDTAAKQLYDVFDSFLKAGFRREEALEIVKTMILAASTVK